MGLGSLFKGIKGKLLIVILIPLLSMVVTTYVAYYEFDNLSGRLNHVYGTLLPNTDRVGSMGTARALVGYFLWASLGNPAGSKERANFLEKAEHFFKKFQEEQKAFEAIPFDEKEKTIYATIASEKSQFENVTTRVLEDIKAGRDEQAKSSINGGEWHIMAVHIREGLDQLFEHFEKQAVKYNAEQKQERQSGMIVLMSVGAVSMVIIMLLVGWISMGLSGSIANVSEILSQTISQVSSAIHQLSAAGTMLSSSTSTSAASLQETVASMEELSSTVKHNSANAKQAADLSNASKDSAQSGETEIRHLIESMKDISTSSRKIEEIINVIDDIAFQTNLLALNAAVEAARAGDQGKGFAVVAEAVRSLAHRSSAAAKDISTLIKESVSKIETGVRTADKSGEVLVSIVRSVNQVSDLNKDISTASQEQTAGIQQISMAMNQLDQSVQVNASSAEEIASTSTEISSQAEKMKEAMEQLNEVVYGIKQAPPVVALKVVRSAPPTMTPSVRAKSAEKIDKAEKMIPFGPASEHKRTIGKVENF